ncbi:MAG TPA: winged helix-turn-helix domain-containing protein, partial [Rheinheimera sp.]|nr:winged helix-turn-helix domain-containing protein [Rheinheimera sp.]
MVRLEPRLHSLLNFFLLHPNTLLAKDTLIEKVWPAEEGTDAAVMRAVGALRKILGDDVRTPFYIATVSKKGYCWLVEPKSAKLPESDVVNDFAVTDDITVADNDVADEHWSWRFILSAAAIILVCCASLAYVLASFTATPLIKLPDTISPISALSGQEYWPVLNADQNKVIYQHQMPDEEMFNWAVQQLSDLRVEHLSERYISLSQAQWVDDSQIAFRALSTERDCHFYQQTIQPVVSAPVMLRPCQAVIQQGLLPWQDKWLWLDTDELGRPQLWTGALNGQAKAILLAQLPIHWRAVENLLAHGEHILLLVQETQNNSALFRLELSDMTPQLIMRFNYLVDQFSWWDENQLLLAPLSQELQLLDIENSQMQALGPLTRELTHAVRYPGQVLATQYLDYTTDIYQVDYRTEAATVDVMPWHVSNRSETLLAHTNGQTVFVSERAGHSQIWLAQGRDSVQLSRLNEHQSVQQLFWHKDQLLVLINGQLFQLSPTTTAMKLYPLQANVPGRYASCDNQLFWTELTDSGWQLFMQKGDTAAVIKTGVVDVR